MNVNIKNDLHYVSSPTDIASLLLSLAHLSDDQASQLKRIEKCGFQCLYSSFVMFYPHSQCQLYDALQRTPVIYPSSAFCYYGDI